MQYFIAVISDSTGVWLPQIIRMINGNRLFYSPSKTIRSKAMDFDMYRVVQKKPADIIKLKPRKKVRTVCSLRNTDVEVNVI